MLLPAQSLHVSSVRLSVRESCNSASPWPPVPQASSPNRKLCALLYFSGLRPCLHLALNSRFLILCVILRSFELCFPPVIGKLQITGCSTALGGYFPCLLSISLSYADSTSLLLTTIPTFLVHEVGGKLTIISESKGEHITQIWLIHKFHPLCFCNWIKDGHVTQAQQIHAGTCNRTIVNEKLSLHWGAAKATLSSKLTESEANMKSRAEATADDILWASG